MLQCDFWPVEWRPENPARDLLEGAYHVTAMPEVFFSGKPIYMTVGRAGGRSFTGSFPIGCFLSAVPGLAGPMIAVASGLLSQ